MLVGCWLDVGIKKVCFGFTLQTKEVQNYYMIKDNLQPALVQTQIMKKLNLIVFFCLS